MQFGDGQCSNLKKICTTAATSGSAVFMSRKPIDQVVVMTTVTTKHTIH